MSAQLRKYAPLIIVVVLLAGYWLLPISGQIVVVPGEDARLPWPRFRLDPLAPQPGEMVTAFVTDVEPWAFVMLTAAGEPATPVGEGVRTGDVWTWRWTFRAPEREAYDLVFYHDCHTGCVTRGRIAVGGERRAGRPVAIVPTKLGVVLPDLQRDWHGRSGWVVELAYARQAEADYWGVDDLAARVVAHRAKRLRVVVRVDYDQGQSIPPVGDYLALTEYLAFVARLASDDRLEEVYGYVVGADYNTRTANAMAPDRITTPAWYARLFSGYGEEVIRSDNVLGVLRAVNPGVRAIVGPVRPWSRDRDGERTYAVDVPWLNYMNTLVALLDESAQVKAEAGIPLMAPDGFDVQAPGRPDAPEMGGLARADEPRADLRREAWDGARIGFGVYRDWMAVINDYPTTRGAPIYVISTNTYDRDADVPPAQNYPAGWLTTALEVIDGEPQVVALCWFLDDFPHSDQWDWFSLAERPGRLVDAAEEFDALLQGGTD